jgi:superfamily II DNA or RNA helicase
LLQAMFERCLTKHCFEPKPNQRHSCWTMSVELSEQFFSKAAGWEAMKMARAYVDSDQVLSSDWSPPLLKGVVQAGGTSYRAGLVIKSSTNIDNICTCRQSREWGTLCAHSVSIGLHYLRSLNNPPALGPKTRSLDHSNTPSVQTPANRGATLNRSETGEPLELFIILPPNLDQALGKGKVMLCFEGAWSRGRSPLNALPKSQSFRLSETEGKLLDQIELLAGGITPPMLMLQSEQFGDLLPLLVDYPSISLGRSTPVAVTSDPLQIPLRARLEPGGEVTIQLERETRRPVRVAAGSSWYFRDNTFQPLGFDPSFGDVFAGAIRISRQQVPQFLNHDWPRLAATGLVQANFELKDFDLAPQSPEFLLELKGGLAQLTALLQCKYGARIMTVGVSSANESLWLPDPGSPTRYGTRDLAAEQKALARLVRSGFTGPDAQGRYQLLGQNAVLNFFAREFPRSQREWKVTMEERLQKSTRENIERIEPAFQIAPSGVQWFDLQVSFTTAGGERFSAADIQRLLLSGQSHTRLRNGKLAVIDTGAVEELQEVLLDCAPEQHRGGYRINNAQAGFLDATLHQHTQWQVQAPSAWKNRVASLSGEANIQCPPLGPLENVLRPYQKQGVAWLHFLRRNGFGGILADEMGLGKTLQTLGLLQTTAEERSKTTRPCLIVCPTSLVFNWVNEAKKFTPDLKVLALTGPDRVALLQSSSSPSSAAGERGLYDFDLIVTSYALIRRDADYYASLEFDTVILDEAQHIKNRQTQNAQAVKSIRSRHRLVLTGTPLENSVLDLWSIFDFLMPGYLGSAQDFRERYEIPITREKDIASQTRLARRLKPFMLRRLKRDVVKDLPARLEQVSFCELTADQQAVYAQVLEASRKEVMEAVGAQGLAKSRMVVLSALLRLRQVCCDLRLLKLEQTDRQTASAKLDLFSELLEEVIDGGHRVLVFSQFVSMLTLIRERLDAEQIAYTYLDGSTPNRGEVVSRFQTDSSIPVFLISLKAGGVGLNLTGADTVIHFDPWWNPAVEAQATDRAHRIGQTRVVTSYKLIARETVEEKIILLQNRKRELIEATLGGEETFAERLNWDDVQELFRG